LFIDVICVAFVLPRHMVVVDIVGMVMTGGLYMTTCICGIANVVVGTCWGVLEIYWTSLFMFLSRLENLAEWEESDVVGLGLG